MSTLATLEGMTIDAEDLRDKPHVGGYFWYFRGNYKPEIVLVSDDLRWVTKIFGSMLSVSDCRGKFYGPVLPTKYGI